MTAQTPARQKLEAMLGTLENIARVAEKPKAKIPRERFETARKELPLFRRRMHELTYVQNLILLYHIAGTMYGSGAISDESLLAMLKKLK